MDLRDAALETRRSIAEAIHRAQELFLESLERVFDHVRVEDLGLQAGEQLFLERAARDEQVVCTNAVAPIAVHGAAIPGVLAFLPSPRNNRDTPVADRTVEQAGEKIGRGSGPAASRSLPGAAIVELLDDFHALADRIPQLVGDNALLGDLAPAQPSL